MTKWRQLLMTVTGHGVSVLITLTAWSQNRVFDDSYWFDSSESLVWKSSYSRVCVSVCIMVCMKLNCLCNIV